MNLKFHTSLALLVLASSCAAQISLNQTVTQDGAYGAFTMQVQGTPGIWASPGIQIFIDDTVGDRQAQHLAGLALARFPWLRHQDVSAGIEVPVSGDPNWRPTNVTTEMAALFQRVIQHQFTAATEMQPLTLETPSNGRTWVATPDIWRPPFLADESLSLKAWRARLEINELNDHFSPLSCGQVALLVQAPNATEFADALAQIGDWIAHDILKIEVQSFAVLDSLLAASPPEDDEDAAGEGLPDLPDFPVVLTTSGHIMTLTLRPASATFDPDFYGMALVPTADTDGTLRVPMAGIIPPLSAEISLNGQTMTLTGGEPAGPQFVEFSLPNGVVAGDQISLLALENYHSYTMLATPISIEVAAATPMGP